MSRKAAERKEMLHAVLAVLYAKRKPSACDPTGATVDTRRIVADGGTPLSVRLSDHSQRHRLCTTFRVHLSLCPLDISLIKTPVGKASSKVGCVFFFVFYASTSQSGHGCSSPVMRYSILRVATHGFHAPTQTKQKPKKDNCRQGAGTS